MDKLKRANELYLAGNTAQARRLFEAVVLEEPNSGLGYLGLANCLLAEGALEDALSASLKASELDPSLTEPLVVQASIQVQRRNLPLAEELLAVALAREPGLASAHQILANVYFQKGRIEDMVQELQKAIELRPDAWILHHNLGVAYSSMERGQDASRELAKAFQLRATPDNFLDLLAARVWLHRIAYNLIAGTAVAAALIWHSVWGMLLVVIPALYVLLLSAFYWNQKNYRRFFLTFLFAVLLIGGYLYYVYRLPPLF